MCGVVGLLTLFKAAKGLAFSLCCELITLLSLHNRFPLPAGLRQRAAALASCQVRGSTRVAGRQQLKHRPSKARHVYPCRNQPWQNNALRCCRYSPESGQLVLGEGAFRLHVAEVNAVVHI